MRIFNISGPVTEPPIEGVKKNFTYVGRVYFAVLDGPVPDGVEEVAWEEDRAKRDEIISVLRKGRRVAALDPVEEQVYDTLRAPTATEQEETFVDGVREQVGVRITAIASLSTQINMSAAAAGGLFDEAQMAAYQAGLAWVAATREKGKEIIRKNVEDYDNDEHWPVPPENAVALAELF